MNLPLLHNRNNGNTPPVGSSGDAPLIQMHRVVKVFQNAAGPYQVLKEIDLDINRGEFVGIIGRSGSGKSTLINMITGIDRPTSGEVLVGGTPVHKLSENQMAGWRGQNLGIVFQFFQLLPMLSVADNVMLPMDFASKYSDSRRKKRALELLELVDMADHANKLPTALSGGQQQRAAIARALANDPPLIIADEPTGNLDSRTADSVFQMFADLVKHGKTIIMVTHDSSLAKRVQRTVLIADGQVVNEYVARALPLLTTDQMLFATRHLEPKSYAPRQTIIEEGQPGDRFYIITQGTVEVVLRRPDGHEVIAARLCPGQYVGEIELVRNRRTVASVRAGPAPLQAVTLDRDTFLQLLSQSDATRAAVDALAGERLAENTAARRRDGNVPTLA